MALLITETICHDIHSTPQASPTYTVCPQQEQKRNKLHLEIPTSSRTLNHHQTTTDILFVIRVPRAHHQQRPHPVQSLTPPPSRLHRAPATITTIMPSSAPPPNWTPAMDAFIKRLHAAGEDPESIRILLETEYPNVGGAVSKEWIRGRLVVLG